MKLKNQHIRSTVLCGLFAALLTVSAWIQIPGAVPFTLQTMVVSILAVLLDWRRSMLTTAVYIGLGVLGLPVFSGFTGGIGVLFGATGGFIIGFIPMVVVISTCKGVFSCSHIMRVMSMVVGTLLCYLTGAVWFAVVYAARGEAMSVSAVLSACVLPFVLPECAKIATAVLITRRLSPLMER